MARTPERGEALRDLIVALERTTAMCRAAITWSPDDIQGLRYHAQVAAREGMAALAAAERPTPFAPGIDIIMSVNAALHAVQANWRIDVKNGQAVAVPTPECYSSLMAAAPPAQEA